MKCKNILMIALLSLGSLVKSSDLTLNLDTQWGKLFSEVLNDSSAFVTSKAKALVGSLKSASFAHTSSYNGGFGDLETFETLPSTGAFPAEATHSVNEGISKAKSGVVSAASSIKDQVRKVLHPAKVEQEKTVWNMVAENPGTTAAVAVGSVVAVYGTYKFVHYLYAKKAKNKALKKHLSEQEEQEPVVFFE